jgi:hypothetical protein
MSDVEIGFGLLFGLGALFAVALYLDTKRML